MPWPLANARSGSMPCGRSGDAVGYPRSALLPASSSKTQSVATAAAACMQGS